MINFLKRSFSALILFLIFAFIFFSENNTLFLLFVSLVLFASLYEMNILLNLPKIKNFIFWSLPIMCFFYFNYWNYDFKYLIIITSFFWILVAPFELFYAKDTFKKANFFYGLIIIFGLFASTIYLYSHDKLLLLLTFSIVWIFDIFAYLSGKFFGKTKLAPKISPGKTIEGVYGGLIANLIYIFFLSLFFDYSFKALIFLIIIIIPLSLLGDLYESLLKRRASKKDSGFLIPGHGGILDRIDSLCPIIPIISSINLLGFIL